jgi:hypothetical protein
MAEGTETGEQITHDVEEGIAAHLLVARGGHAGMEDDVRGELRKSVPCGLATVSDEEVVVHRTAGEDGFLTYRASVPCAEPGCVTFERENQWVLALHRRLDDAGERDMVHDPLERAFSEFEGVYWWAARHPTSERLEHVARWRPELARLAAARFPDLPAPAPAGTPNCGR